MNVKYLVAVAAVAFAVTAWATPAHAHYCDYRQTQSDYENCYRVNLQAQSNLMEKTYREAVNHPNLDAANLANLEQNQREWTNWVNANCRDNACFLVQFENRNSHLRKYLKDLQSMPVVQQAAPSTGKAELYCSNMSDTCTLTINGQDLELTREQLPKHVGFYQGDRSSCIAESCLGSKGEFLGLNPDYYQQ